HAARLEGIAVASEALREAIDGLEPYLEDGAREAMIVGAAERPLAIAEEATALREALSSFDTLQAIDDVLEDQGEVELEAYAHLRETGAGWADRLRRAVVLGWIEEAEAQSR